MTTTIIIAPTNITEFPRRIDPAHIIRAVWLPGDGKEVSDALFYEEADGSQETLFGNQAQRLNRALMELYPTD